MADIDKIIDEIIHTEDQTDTGVVVNDPTDPGGRTQYGISERSNPEAWVDGKVTKDEAHEIFKAKYVIYPGFDKIADTHLMTQLVDYGINSGQAAAIMKLQTILGLHADGILGPKTLEALSKRDPKEVNNLLVAARIRMLAKIVQQNPRQLKDLFGWVDRALSFLRS